MKKNFPHLITIWILIGLLLISSSAFASHVVTDFRDNRKGAVSISFDDGNQSPVTNGVPQMNARNIRGTFFIQTSYGELSLETLRELASQGHEIGSHSVSHVDLTLLSETDLRWELSESQRLINLNIPAATCVSFSYPYGRENEQVRAVTSEYYIAGRNVWPPLNYYENGPYGQAVDFYNVGSYGADSMNIGKIDIYLDQAEQRNAWFSVFMHYVQDSALFAQLLDHILTRDLWIDTFSSIVRYMRERLSSTVTVLSETSTEIQLDLTHSLNNAIYNEPLTLRSTVPSSWLNVKVRQGENVVTVNTLSEGSETVVYYNALPNMGIITLTEGSPLETVSAPSVLIGPNAGITGDSYVYSTGGSYSSLDHAVEYQFDWTGDGVTDLSSWGSAVQSKTWTVAGSYNVKARARCVTDTNVISSWSNPIIVNIAPAVQTYTLTVNVVGSGSVTKIPDQVQYGSGAVVQLTAVPVAGWVFGGWSGDLTGSTNPASITMNGNKTVTATFVQQTYTLMVNVMGSGSVTKNPDQAQYSSGSVVQLRAVPAAGWVFSGWSGDLTGSTNPASITMNGNKTVTAIFVQQTYTLTVNVMGSGSVTKVPDQVQYSSGAVVQLRAVPVAGWVFSGWSGDLTGSTNPASITMNGNKTVTATFVQTYSYAVTTSPSGRTFNVDGVTYTTSQRFVWGVGSTHSISVLSPQQGASGTRYVYNSWSDSGAQTHSITAPSSNTTYTAFFDTQYTLTTDVIGSGGTVSPSGTNWYNSGQVVSITAIPMNGYRFLRWSGGLTGNTNPASITMTGPKNIRATFRRITH